MSGANLSSTVRRYHVLHGVYNALGFSTIYTEHRGNFSAGLRLAEYDYQLYSHEGGTRLAAALIARGIVHILQGRVSSALKELNDAIEFAEGDTALQLLALLYAYHATRTQYDFLPDHGSGAAKDIKARFNGGEALQLWHSQMSYLANGYRVDARLRIERQVLQLYQSLTTIPRVQMGQGHTPHQLRNSMLQLCDAEYNELATQNPDPAVLAHLRILRSKTLFRGARRQEAVRELDAVESLCNELNDIVGLANVALTRGDWLVAPVSNPDVWNSCLGEGTYDSSLHWEIDIAEVNADIQSTDKPLSYYNDALFFFESANVQRGVAAVRSRLGYLAVVEGLQKTNFECYFSAASDNFEQSSRILRETGDDMAFQLSQAHLALCAIGQGERPEQVERAASIGRWGRDEGSFGFTLGIGVFFARMGWRWITSIGDYERALACFHLARALFYALDAKLSHIHALVDQFRVYRMLGDFPSCSRMSSLALESCMNLISQASSLRKDAKDIGKWVSLQMLGLASERAAPELIDSVRRYIRLTHATKPALTQQVLARVIDNMNTLLARPQATAARDAPAQTDIPQDSLQNVSLSNVTSQLLQHQLADAELYQELYRGKELRKVGDTVRAQIHFDCVIRSVSSSPASRRYQFEALAYAYAGQYSEARSSYDRCVELELRQVDTQARMSRHNPLSDDGRRQIAVRALMFYCEIGHFGAAQKWLNILQAWQNWSKAEGQEWKPLYYIARVREGTGDLVAALPVYEEAIKIFEIRRQYLSIDGLKVAFAADSSTKALFFGCARTVMELLHRPNTSPEQRRNLESKLFNIVERSKARSLLDLMGGGLVGRSTTTRANARLDLQRLQARRATHCGLLELEMRLETPNQSTVDHLKETITKDEEDITMAEKAMSASGQQDRPVTAKVSSLISACQSLPGRTLVLHYMFDNERLLAWATSREGIEKIHQKELPLYQLNQKTKDFHTACQHGDPALSNGHWLSNELLKPFKSLLDMYKRLVVIPHGFLHLVPFHALPFPDIKPLACSHVITYLPSASVLRYLEDPRLETQHSTLLALGNPRNMSFQGINGERVLAHPLPGSRREVVQIGEIMPGSKVLLGAEATLANLKKHIKDHPILHLSTHCRIVSEVPMLSSVSLADHQEFSILDLLGMNLDLDLVVLSACQTAQGEVTAGDDVVGFTRAILAAGARAVIVSLWPVDDEATADLFIQFYECISRGKSIADALHEAQQYLWDLCGSNGSEHAVPKAATAEGARLHLSGTGQNGQLRTHRQNQVHLTRQVEPEVEEIIDYSLPKFWAPFTLITAPREMPDKHNLNRFND